ncbi:hypothetical protein VUR80DRAFT_2899 [Thermomyces stellatus]
MARLTSKITNSGLGHRMRSRHVCADKPRNKRRPAGNARKKDTTLSTPDRPCDAVRRRCLDVWWQPKQVSTHSLAKRSARAKEGRRLKDATSCLADPWHASADILGHWRELLFVDPKWTGRSAPAPMLHPPCQPPMWTSIDLSAPSSLCMICWSAA